MYLCLATTDFLQTEGNVLTVSALPRARTITAGDVEDAPRRGPRDGATRMLGGIAINNFGDCEISGGIGPTDFDNGNVSINHTRLPISNAFRNFAYAYCLVAPPGQYLSEVELRFGREFREDRCRIYFDKDQRVSFYICVLQVLEGAGSIQVDAIISENVNRENEVIQGPYAAFLSQDEISGPVTAQTLKAAINRVNLR